MANEFPSLWDRLADEFSNVFDTAKRQQDLVQPTPDEAANGWTAETLTEYLAECVAGQTLAIDPHSLHSRAARRPRWANSAYSPMRWRG